MLNKKQTLREWEIAWEANKKDFPQSMQMLAKALLNAWKADRASLVQRG